MQFQAVVDSLLKLEDNLASFTMQYSVSSTVQLRLTADWAPVATVCLSACMEGVLRASGYRGSLSIVDFVVMDDVTPNPVIGHVVALQGSERRSSGSRAPSRSDGEGGDTHPVVVHCESKQRRTKVVIRAVPVEVCCHPLCVQKLVDMLLLPRRESLKPSIRTKYHDIYAAPPPSRLSAGIGRPMAGGGEEGEGEGGMDGDDSGNELMQPLVDMVLGVVEVQLEASAPKIIFPEDCSVDEGYLLLDMGHLSVQGCVQYSGMAWSTTFSDVRVAMPTRAADMYKEEGNVFVEPFVVSTTVRTQRTSCLEVKIQGSVQSSIVSYVDPTTLARLLRVWEVVSYTFFRVRSLYRLKQLILRASTTSEDQLIFRTAIDFAPAIVNISFAVQEVQLWCRNVDLDNAVVIRVTEVSSYVCKGIYDMRIGVNLLSIDAEDMARAPNQRHVVATPQEDGNNFVKLAILLIRDRKSVHFDEYGTIVDVECGKLNISSDQASLYHFRPFIEAMRGKSPLSHGPLDTSFNHSPLTSTAESTQRFLFAESATPFLAPSGVQLTVSLREVSVSLLRPHASCAVLYGAVDSRTLEVVVTVDIEGIKCAGKLKGDVDVVLALRRMRVFDCRQRSRDNYFKTLLSYSSDQGRERYAPFSGAEEWGGDGECKVSRAAASIQAQTWPQEGGEGAAGDQVELTYRQGEGGESKQLSAVVRGLHCFVSLDAALDISEAVLMHAKHSSALLSFPSPPTDSGTAPSLSGSGCSRDAEARARQTSISMHTFLSSLTAHVSVLSSQLVLLEDPAAQTSRAVVCRTSVDVKMEGSRRSLIDDDEDGGDDDRVQITETMRVAANNFEIFVILNMATWQPLQILHPLCVHVHASNSVMDGVSTSRTLSVNVEDVVLRVTVADVLLVQSIIVRRTANDYAPPVFVGIDDVETFAEEAGSEGGGAPVPPLCGAQMYMPTQVTLWKAIFTLGKASLVLINDTEGFALAMARVGVEQVHLKADGSSHGVMVGSGAMAVNMDYYNPSVNEWEPCVEVFYPEVTLRGDDRCVTAGLCYNNSIQLNVTSAMLSLFSETLSFLRTVDTAEEAMRTLSSSATVTFRNALGMPVELYDSSCRDNRLFRLEAGQEACIFLVHSSPYSRQGHGQGVEGERPLAVYSAGGLHLTLPVLPPAVDLQVINTSSELTYRRIGDLPLTAKQPSQHPLTPLQVIAWDSSVRPDGSRAIRIQSTLEIINDLPFRIMVISNNAVEPIGPIGEHQAEVMPLVYVYAECAGISFKPSDLPFEWSENMLCMRQAKDYSRLVDLCCFDETGDDVIAFRARITQSQTLVQIRLFPVSIITNALPCGMRYQCTAHGGPGEQRGGGALEQGALEAGATATLSHMGSQPDRHLVLYIEGLGWSRGKVLRSSDAVVPTNIYFLGEDQKEVLLVVSVIYLPAVEHDTSTILVYSKYLVVDRSSLGVSISTRVEKGDGSRRITRTTFDPLLLETPPEDSVEDVVIVDMADGSTIAMPDAAAVPLLDFTVKSRRKYELTLAGIGVRMHTDRELRFSYLPVWLRGHSFVCTPCDDRSLVMDAGSSLMEFSVDLPVVVCVIFDYRCKSLPGWVRTRNYRRIADQCIARGYDEGLTKELFYSIYGRVFDAGSRVQLGYNYSKASRGMYSVCVLPTQRWPGGDAVWEQVTYDPAVACVLAEKGWARGGYGCTLFNCENGRVKLGVNRGSAWTERSFSIKTLGDKVPLEIADSVTDMGYQLAYRVHRLPLPFEHTQVLSVMNRYCLVNCTGEPIAVRQVGTEVVAPALVVNAYSSQAWHKSIAQGTTTIQLKCQSTDWSIGHFDVNEVGTTQMFLPFLQNGQHIFPTVINVEVKLAELSDDCAVSIILWRSNEGRSSPLSIKNTSHYTVSLLQANVPAANQPYCEVHVPPNVWVPYGWARPEEDLQVIATLADSVRMSSPYHCCTVNVFDAKDSKQLLSDVAVVSIESQPQGRIIYIRDYTDCFDVPSPPLTKRNILWDIFLLSKRKYCTVTMSIKNIGVSIIADRPTRRELFAASLDGLDTKAMFSKNVLSVDCSLTDVQIDNHAETAIYPVLLWRPPDYNKSSRDIANVPPFIQFAGVRELHPGPPTTCVYRYLTGRVMPFLLEVDSASLELFVIDFLSSLHVVSADERKAKRRPVEWMQAYNADLLSPLTRQRVLDIHDCLRYCQQSKALFENIIFHPIKVYFTFVALSLPPDRQADAISSYWVDLLGALVTVDLLEIRLKSFIVASAVESTQSLSRRLQAKVVQDIEGQLAQIAGSVVLGSPAGLLRNIGGGVQVSV